MQVSYITVVSDSKTHSERLACIYDSGRYYIVFTLWLDIVLIIVYLVLLTEAGYCRNCSAVKRGFLKPQKPPSKCPWTSLAEDDRLRPTVKSSDFTD